MDLISDVYKAGQDRFRCYRIPAAILTVDGDRICSTYMITSQDDGKSWSGPIEKTRSVKRPVGVTNYAGGPGTGIQIKEGKYRGRIIMPFAQGPWSDMKVYAVYSDDHGENWNRGETAPNSLAGMPNEVQMAELDDGRIMLNARVFKGERFRMTSISENGGKSWSPLAYDMGLKDPGCQGSLLRLANMGDDRKSMLLFSNPDHQKKRINGTIRLSEDNGNNWKWSRSLYQSSFAYSSLVDLKSGQFGVLYERDNYSRISFSRLNIKWLKG